MIDTIICIYWLVTYSLLYFGFNISAKNTAMLAAFIHSTLTCAYSAIILSILGINFLRYNSLGEIIITKISLWYFIYDIIYLLIFNFDIIYLVHHLCAIITFYYILSLDLGISACMITLFLGEISNPFRIAKQMSYEHNRIVYNILNFLFRCIFLIARCPLMTYYAYVIHKDFIRHMPNNNTKNMLYISYGLGLLGSYYWSYLLVKKIFN